MWLVLCSATDIPALWAARELAARGLQPLEIVTPEALAYCRRFSHRLSSNGSATEIVLADGRIIHSEAVRGTLNRLQAIPVAHLICAIATDRRYAQQELFALYLSWLHALPGKMLNRPTPRGLCGEWRHASEWIWLAARAGLSSAPYRKSDRGEAAVPARPVSNILHSVIAVKGQCCGAIAPGAVAEACDRLLDLSGVGLLGINFDLGADGLWMFREATPFPDLRLGGTKLIDGLHRALTS